MLQRVFIANRGEIVRRIAISAKKIGMESVCVVEQDAIPKYLIGIVDHFVEVDHISSSLFLSADRMISFAKELGCDCIHPGYGFLSENDEFAQKVVRAGLSWIGPPAKVIREMGNKIVARNIAEKQNVPCIPGLTESSETITPEQRLIRVKEFASRCGYPVLIKAAFGGGGKGMRIISSEDEIEEAVSLAASEALSAFGNGALLVERYISQARHVEVQILADQFGNVKILGDRDCSLQRRHQKIIEEAPAPDLPEALRKNLHDNAKDLAKGVDYLSAGTVEFIVNWSEEARTSTSHEYYFLEMNTRLQVEHPVTEEVFGVDLVEWQFRVAMGEELPSDLVREKHSAIYSIEARIYAEDVEAFFFPAPGFLYHFDPAYRPGIRWEIGTDSAAEVSPEFDPMIAKVVATSSSRRDAITSLLQTLRATNLVGLKTNLDFLCYVLSESPFSQGPLLTTSVETLHPSFQNFRPADDEILADLAESLLEPDLQSLSRSNQKNSELNPEKLTLNVFKCQKSAGVSDVRFFSSEVVFTEQKPSAYVECRSGLCKKAERHHAFSATLVRDGEKHFLALLLESGARASFDVVQKRSTRGLLAADNQSDSKEVISSFPGKVLKIIAQENQHVSEGDVMFVLESMKMEMSLKSHRVGKIQSILVSEGEQVSEGKILARME